jgi:YD repeat-containing protein
MSGHAIPTPGTWTFSYGTGANQDTTQIVCPCGGTTRYRFNGTGVNGTFSGWNAGTLAEVTLVDGAVTLDDRTLTWTPSDAISTDPVSGPNGIWSDPQVYRPLLQQQQITRDGQTFTTTHTYHTGAGGNFNDYGQPYDTEETNGASPYQARHTTRTFQYGFTPYIVGRLASVSVTETVAYGQSDGTTSSSWTYDLATGFLTSQTIRGFITTFQERADGNVGAAVDGLGNTTTFGYDWGHVNDVRTPNLHTTYTIVPEGLVTAETHVGTSPDVSFTTGYVYDAALRLHETDPPGANPITYTPDDVHGSYVRVAQGGSTIEHDVDAFGREWQVFNSLGLKRSIIRDLCGRVTFDGDPYTNTWTGQGTSYQYDALGRVTKVTDAAGHSTTITPSGADVTRTDANAHTTTYHAIAFGDPANARLASVTDAAGNMTLYRYDVTGALASVSGPASGVTRTWVINAHGLPDSETQPESGTTSYTYDAVGNLATTTDANGTVTTLTYDHDNRLATRSSSGDSTDNVTITYDSLGRVKTLTGTAATTTYSANVAARTVTRADTTSAGTFSSTSTRDANDNLSQILYPTGRTVAYHYDAENRLTEVDHTPPGASSSSVFASSFTYGDDGRLASYLTGAVTHNFTYQFDRPSHLWTSGGSAPLDLTYGYDNVGNVTGITDPRTGASQSFGLDALDRLTTATGPWGSLQWTYDAAGNRTAETTGSGSTTYTYNAATQRLASTSGQNTETFTYDTVGQLTSDGIISQYTYSPLGHLKGATRTSVNASYAYDPSGERLSKSTVAGQTIYSIRGGSGETLSEYQNSCGAVIWTRDLIYAGGQLLGAAKAVATQPTISMASATASVSETASSVPVSVVLTTPNGAALGCAASVVVSIPAAGANWATFSQTVTFASGSANGATQSVSIPLSDDHLFNGNQTLTVSLSGPAGGAIGATPTEVITIVETDLPTIAFAASTTSVNENAGTANLVVSVGNTTIALPAAISTQYAFTNGTAVNGTNYRGTAGTVTFPAGSGPGATQTIPVRIIDDDVYAGNLTFSAALSAPSGATLASPTSVTVTIVETDPPPAPVIVLEAPGDGTIWGSHVSVSGYAYDAHAMNGGTGITAVNVYAYPNADQSQTPVFLGTASYGTSRPDVCSGQFTNCGFSLAAVLPSTGTWLVRAFGQDPLGATFYASSNTKTFTVQPTPRMNVDVPANGTVASYFWISGWAIDAGAGSGTGVDLVQVWAYPNPGSGQSPVFVGTATYGGSRPDVGAAYGSQFTPSGFGLSANLGAGYYQVVVYAHSTVTGSWSQAQSVYVTVTAGIYMSVDTPANNATVSQTFAVGGWAVDTRSSSGTGVAGVSIIVTPDGGSATGYSSAYGGSRPDVGAYFQDSRFTPSGWGATLTLSPGGYTLSLYPLSTVTGTFGPPTVIHVTVQ